MIDAEGLLDIQALVRLMPVGESGGRGILDLVRAARPGEGDPEIDPAHRLGAGPARRAGADAGLPRPRACAGRLAPSKDDVLALAAPVLQTSHGADL